MKIRHVVAPLLALGIATTLSVGTVSSASAASSPVVADTVRARSTVTVPNVVGENVGIAIDQLHAAGFTLIFKEYKDNNCSYDKFEVVRQNPAGGSVVNFGSTVTLWFAVWPAPPAQCP